MMRKSLFAKPAAVAAAFGVLLLAGGCDTGPLLRDNYWGKSVLQPHKVLEPARRDGMGNPVPQD